MTNDLCNDSLSVDSSMNIITCTVLRTVVQQQAALSFLPARRAAHDTCCEFKTLHCLDALQQKDHPDV